MNQKPEASVLHSPGLGGFSVVMFFLRGTFLFLLLLFSPKSFSTDNYHGSEQPTVSESDTSKDEELGQNIIERLTELRDSKDKVDPKYLEQVKADKEKLDLTDEQIEEIDKLIAELEGKKQEQLVTKSPTELLKELSDSFNKKLSPSWSDTVAESTIKGFNTGVSTGTKFGAPVLGGAVGAAAGCINGICNALSKPQPTHASSASSQSNTQQLSSFDSSSTETPSVAEAPPERAPASQSPQSTQPSNSTPNQSSKAESAGVDTTTGKPVSPKNSTSPPVSSPKKISSSLPPANTPFLHGGEEQEKVFGGNGGSVAALNSTSSPQQLQIEKSERAPKDPQQNGTKPSSNPHPGAASASPSGSRLGSNVASFRGTTEELPAGEGSPLPRETASVSNGTYSWRKGGEPNTASGSGSSSQETISSSSSTSFSSSNNSSPSFTSSSESNLSSSSSNKRTRNKTGEKENATYLDLSPTAGNEESLEENLKEIAEATGTKELPERTPEEKARVAEKIQQVLDLSPPLLSKEGIKRGPASDLSNLLEATENAEEVSALLTPSPAVKAKGKLKVSPNKISTAGNTAPPKSFFDKILGFFQI